MIDTLAALDDSFNKYEPTAQETLKTVQALSENASVTIQDTGTFIGSLEALLQKSGTQLDSGTKKTLEGLAATLREAAKSTSKTGDVKSAKGNINSIIEDTWNEHSGDLDNLLNMQSAAIEAGVSRVMEESNAIFRSNEYQKNEYRWGYSVEGQGTSGFMRNFLQGVVTLVPSLNTGKAASRNFLSYTRTSVDNTPAYAMIVSSGNSRLAQVESGMLYSKLVLTGHKLGLAMQPLSQVLEEYPEMKSPYTEFQQAYAPNGGTVQMLFRVGVPTQSVPLSMQQSFVFPSMTTVELIMPASAG